MNLILIRSVVGENEELGERGEGAEYIYVVVANGDPKSRA